MPPGKSFPLLLGAALTAAFLAASPPAAASVEIRIGGGGWTLAPFHPLIESRSKEAVQAEFNAFLEAALPQGMLSPVRADIDLASSGGSLFAELWLPLGRGRFALGVRGDVFRFRIPFTASASETIQLIGFPLAELNGTAAGTVRLEGLGLSLLGRWTVVSAGSFEVGLRAGISVLPFRGRLSADGILQARTILGNFTYAGGLEGTMAEIREGGADVPSLVLAPAAGLETAFRLDRRWRIFAALTVSHGTFYSAGLSGSF